MARVWLNASLAEVTPVSPQVGLGVCDITVSFASDTDSIILLTHSLDSLKVSLEAGVPSFS